MRWRNLSVVGQGNSGRLYETLQLLHVPLRVAIHHGEHWQQIAIGLALILYRESTDFQARFAGPPMRADSVCLGWKPCR